MGKRVEKGDADLSRSWTGVFSWEGGKGSNLLLAINAES
jgi:hypothetical protein